ncbi:MAG: glycosyltransferase [Lachnospiraceae bacterium]|nr:glycosyltransferase [Lachnospiraceae bacterium]
MCKISVIIPVYNVELYLKECLESVLQQEYKNIEVICIEDCSTDNSKKVLESIAREDCRVRVFLNKNNSGLSKSRNIGIDMARGEYLLFLDSDDYLVDNSLKVIVQKADELSVDMLSFDSKSIYEGSRITYDGKRKKTYKNEVLRGGDAFVEQRHNGDYKVPVWQYLYRRDFIKRNELYFVEGIYHEDVLFTFFAYMYANKVMFLNELVHMYRVRKESITTSKSLLHKRIEDLVLIYEQSYIQFAKLNFHDRDILGSQLEYVRYNILKYYHMCDSEQKIMCRECLSDGIQQHIFDTITNSYKEITISYAQLKLMRSKEKIYIFGAGEWGRRWIRVLEELDINIGGIVVSDKHKNVNELYGYKVYEVAEICREIHEEINMILAVAKEQALEIKSSVKEINNITFIYEM